MEVILCQASALITAYRSEQTSVGGPDIFRPAKSGLHGDIFASREVSSAVKQKLESEVCS